MSEFVKVIGACLIGGCLLPACDKAPIKKEFVEFAMNDVEKMNAESDALTASLWDERYLKEMTEIVAKSRATIDGPSLRTQSERFKGLFESNAPEVADLRFKTIKAWIVGLGGTMPDDLLQEHLHRIALVLKAFDPDGLEGEWDE